MVTSINKQSRFYFSWYFSGQNMIISTIVHTWVTTRYMVFNTASKNILFNIWVALAMDQTRTHVPSNGYQCMQANESNKAN